jgi:transposase-like protein
MPITRTTPQAKAYYKQYQETQKRKESLRAARKAWELNNPEKVRAKKAAKKAIEYGLIQRRNECEECQNQGKLHAHHDDYAKPLEVRFLCPQCHVNWHIENGEGKT